MKPLIYLFSFYPGAKFAWFYPLLILFLLIFAGSIALSVFLKKQKNIAIKSTFEKLPGHLQVLSILGILLLLARISGVGFFSMRAFLFVLLGTLLALLIANIRKYFISLPQKTAENFMQREYNKYLPKKKKRR